MLAKYSAFEQLAEEDVTDMISLHSPSLNILIIIQVHIHLINMSPLRLSRLIPGRQLEGSK
ncbi:MAG: hypothetical protein IPO72_00100 [Saprospiraceae bacterium]|nr:hypothetical protein [Candidatus Vicinibacter affinis]